MKKKFWLTAFVSGIIELIPIVACAVEAAPVDSGTTAWVLTSTALVLLMVPGLAMFYGGRVRTKNVLSTMMHSFVAMAVIGVLWVVCGYSIAFGSNILGGFAGWNNDYFFLKGIDDTIVKGVPEYVLAMFQGKFAIIAPALISGALAERVYFRGLASSGCFSHTFRSATGSGLRMDGFSMVAWCFTFPPGSAP